MSILIVGAAGAVGEALITRLVDQGDEVRVVEPDAEAAGRWRALGAHVAAGSPDDADLVERAGQNARTVVALPGIDLDPVRQGAAAARVERLVSVAYEAHELPPRDADAIVLVVPRTRVTRRSLVAPEALAEAIDAADDLAGNPRLVVDLGSADGWAALGLDPPSG